MPRTADDEAGISPVCKNDKSWPDDMRAMCTGQLAMRSTRVSAMPSAPPEFAGLSFESCRRDARWVADHEPAATGFADPLAKCRPCVANPIRYSVSLLPPFDVDARGRGNR